MKNLLLIAVFSIAAVCGYAQSQSSNAPTFKFPPVDKSPMDMAYFPANYPVLKIQEKATEPPVVRAIYSRPQREGRQVFGELVEYNKIWRLGANEATEIEFYRDVQIKDKKLAKGRYTLFAIPTQEQWTIVFNKDNDIWGAFKYDEKKDVLRTDVPVQTTSHPVESFSLTFNKSSAGADLVIAWDNVMVTVPITIK